MQFKKSLYFFNNVLKMIKIKSKQKVKKIKIKYIKYIAN